MKDVTDDLKYWLGFSLVPGIGRVKFSQLEAFFGTLSNAWKATTSELKQAGLDRNAVQSISETRPKISPDAEIERLDKLGIQAFNVHSTEYPTRLKEIYDYPPVLFIRGALRAEDELGLAVVGTRRATVYGRQVTEELVTDLVRNGITIVSGLAKGIDSVAHRTALEAGGRTLAVFACGLDTVYPPENAELARRIINQGALISEHPPGTKPRPEFFPRRNRILSGLSLGVLVIEAGESSGAIITANMAAEQNREVFAVPGSILSPASSGANMLLQEGAKLVRNCTDILEELNLNAVAQQLEMKEIIPPSDTEAQLLKLLKAEPSHIDEICRSSGLPASTVSSSLAMMELKGMVKQLGGMNYSLAREVREEYQAKI